MNSKSNLILIIVFATIFGMLSGIVGAIVSRVYILEDAFNVPLFGEISFMNRQSGSNLIIRDAKKVVIEQNVKVEEVARSGRESLVGIYKKKIIEADIKNKGIGLEDFYKVDDFLHEAFIITSDGWLIADFLPDKIASLLKSEQSTSSKIALEKAFLDYVVIDKNNNIYDVREVVSDVFSNYAYWKIGANDLPVKKFVSEKDIKSGQMTVAVNLEGKTWTSTVSGVNDGREFVKSSDVYEPIIALNEATQENFYSSFLFDLNGDLLGLINSKGDIIPINNFLNCINCLLEKRDITRSSLGIYYVNLSQTINPDDTKIREGALVYKNKNGISVVKNSPAYKAGLLEGDIIISINGIVINQENDLAYLIGKYKSGEKISMELLREGKRIQINVELGEL